MPWKIGRIAGLMGLIARFMARLSRSVMNPTAAMRRRSQRKEQLERLVYQRMWLETAARNLGLSADRWVKRKHRKLFNKRYTDKRPFRRDSPTVLAMLYIQNAVHEELDREISGSEDHADCD